MSVQLDISRDRLTSTLFLAALFHGLLIMGVSFAPPEPDDSEPYPTLDVVLVADPTEDQPEPDNPEYVAQHTQRGGGNTTERVRAAAPLTRHETFRTDGLPDGADRAVADPGEILEAEELLASRGVADVFVQAVPETSVDTQFDQMLPAEASPEVVPFPLVDEQETLELRSENPRELMITANTRESRVAEYLDSWKRKIERVGTLNFPNEVRRRDLSGSPTVEVAISADGSLAEVHVRRSSGHKLLDRAALSILRLAAPFDPFPEHVRLEYDVLRVAYEWQFIGGQLVDSSARIRVEE